MDEASAIKFTVSIPCKSNNFAEPEKLEKIEQQSISIHMSKSNI